MEKLNMAHEIQKIAYREEEVPWHKLGSPLSPNQPLEVWSKEAGFDWEIKEAPVLFNVSEEGGFHVKNYADNKVLYRSDNHTALSVCSNRYKTVQPSEVLGFFKDITEAGGFTLETAGMLRGGKRFWSLAKTGQEVMLKGGDCVKGYLLLATSADGSMATTATYTSIRVCCANTLAMAIGSSTGAIKVSHSTEFHADKVKEQLGIGISTWQRFVAEMKALADRKVTPFEARSYFINVLGDPDQPVHQQSNAKVLDHVIGLYNGNGMGSQLASANGTAFGMLNAITEWVDHERPARTTDNRITSAWFGTGNQLKEKGYIEALKLAA
jgi:phage/plasmid-like protein (TIGR03299 family)